MQDRKLKAKIDYKVLGRVMKYIIKNYKFKFIIVLICIVLATASSVAGDLYLQTLIDDYIVPLVGVTNPIYTGLIHAISFMIGIYLIGVIASFLHSRFMVYITEGVIKTIRDEMFVKMQKLPIKYFDTHTHGDIMSHYTNDIDTLNQMISQSIPQALSSGITIVTVVISMFLTNIYLTAVVIV